MANYIVQSIEIAKACRSMDGMRPGIYCSNQEEGGDNIVIFPSMVFGEGDLVAKILFRNFQKGDQVQDQVQVPSLYFSSRFQEENIMPPKVCEVSLLGHFSAMHIVAYDRGGSRTLPVKDFLLYYANRRLHRTWVWKPSALYCLETEILASSNYDREVLEGQISLMIKPHLKQYVAPHQDCIAQVLYQTSKEKPRPLLVANLFN